jgi:hypothetical protein
MARFHECNGERIKRQMRIGNTDPDLRFFAAWSLCALSPRLSASFPSADESIVQSAARSQEQPPFARERFASL